MWHLERGLWRRHRSLLYHGASPGIVAAQPPEAAAAQAFDARVSHLQDTEADPWGTFDFTYDAAADMVVVIASWETGQAETLVGVTIGGVAMDRITGSLANQADSTKAEAFYIDKGAGNGGSSTNALPAGGGAQAIQIDHDGSTAGYAFAWSFTGAPQVMPGATPNQNSSTQIAVTRTGVAEGALLCVGSNHNDVAGDTGHTYQEGGWTERYDNNGAAGGQWGTFADQGPVTAGDKTATIARDAGSSHRNAATMVEI